VVKCPYCSYEGEVSEFRFLKSPWRFRFYEVKTPVCPRCGKVSNYYRGVSPKTNGISEFVTRIRSGGVIVFE